jgi:hypothetical protein
MTEVTHEHLWSLCQKLPSDFEPYGVREREGGDDCSSGCKWFVPLKGKLGYDWGVCACEYSPRVGLLTFEHQGCPLWEWGPLIFKDPKEKGDGQEEKDTPGSDIPR